MQSTRGVPVHVDDIHIGASFRHVIPFWFDGSEDLTVSIGDIWITPPTGICIPGDIAPEGTCMQLGVCGLVPPRCVSNQWECPIVDAYEENEVSCDGLDNDCDGITDEELDRACSTDPEQPRLLILNYPNNPSGSSYPQEELAELAEIARTRKLVILSDEIYGEVHHDGEHVSIARFYPEGTILSAGLSKWCGAGGWRLGTFLFPPALRWLQDAMGAIASETFTATSAPIQYAAVRAFEGGEEIEQYLLHSRRILKAIATSLVTSFEDAGIRVVKPAGGFYLFLDFSQHTEAFAARGITNGQELTNRLLEEAGVAILPGEDFGRPQQELSARLAYVNFDGERALAAAANSPSDTPLPSNVLEETCGDVLKGANRLCDWVKGVE